MKLNEVPYWLKKSDLYRNLVNNDPLEDVDENIKILDTPEILDYKTFKKVYKISSYWSLDSYPIELYIFSFLNKEKVLKFLLKNETIESINLYGDIKNDFSLKKYKNYIIDNFKSEHEIISYLNSFDDYDVELKITSSEGDDINFNKKYEDVHDNIEDISEFNFEFSFLNKNNEKIALHEISLKINSNYLKSRKDEFNTFLENIKKTKNCSVSYIAFNDWANTAISYKKEMITFSSSYRDIQNGDNGTTEFKLKINNSIIKKLKEMYEFMKINNIN